MGTIVIHEVEVFTVDPSNSVVASKQHPEVLINPPVITISVGFYFILHQERMRYLINNSCVLWFRFDVIYVSLKKQVA